MLEESLYGRENLACELDYCRQVHVLGPRLLPPQLNSEESLKLVYQFIWDDRKSLPFTDDHP